MISCTLKFNMPSDHKVDKATPKIKEFIAKTPDNNPTK